MNYKPTIAVILSALSGIVVGLAVADMQPKQVPAVSPFAVQNAPALSSSVFPAPDTPSRHERRDADDSVTTAQPHTPTPVEGIGRYLHRSLGTKFSVEEIKKLAARVRAHRSQEAYGERLNWSTVSGQDFELMAQWKSDLPGLTRRVNSSSEGVDVMWMVAAGNPAHSWSLTSDWVAGLEVNSFEQADLLEQIARKSTESGEGGLLAEHLANSTAAVYDQAKATLAVLLAQGNPTEASRAWYSISSESAKMTAAVEVLSTSTDPAARAVAQAWVNSEPALFQSIPIGELGAKGP